MVTAGEKTEKTIPDARKINRELDIRKVAHALDIRKGGGSKYHCWHPENHRNGDVDASVGYWATGNRFHCFVCGKASIGVIDLVMDVKNCEFKHALRWIASRFQVRMIRARKPIDKFQRRGIDSQTDPMAYLVRAHIFCLLSGPAQQVATVLAAYAEKPESSAGSPRTVKISYKGLQRYAGLSSPNAISKGLKELELIGWLRRKSERRGVLKTTGQYVITPFAESVTELGHSLARQEQSEIEYERSHAKERRAAKDNAFRERQRATNACGVRSPLCRE